MPYENEHSCRLKDPSVLNGADRVTRVTKDDGRVFITGFWGPKEKATKAITQAVRYPKGSFSADKAKADCSRLGGTFEQAKKASMTEDEIYVEELILKYAELIEPEGEGETGELLGQPVAITGKWKGHDFTEDDLDEMIRYFEDLSETEKRNIHVKLGHGDQSIVRNSGLVSVGWVKRLYRKGIELFADMTAIPRMVLRMIKNKTLKELSPEVGINFTDNTTGKTYRKIIDAVALLPWGNSKHKAMKTLKDLGSLYADEGDNVEIEAGSLVLNMSETAYMTEEEPEDKTKKSKKEDSMGELEKLQEEIKEKDAKIETFKEQEKELEDLKNKNKELAEANEKFAEDKSKLEKEKKTIEVEKFMEDNKTKITPAIKSRVKALLLHEDTEEIEYFDEENESHKSSVPEVIKSVIKDLPNIVDYEEKSELGEISTGGVDETDAKLKAKVEKYRKEHKIESFTEAFNQMQSEGLIKDTE
jgi:hypothetical protein